MFFNMGKDVHKPNFRYKDFLIFIILFFFTIGSKQIFYFLEGTRIEYTFIIVISLVLSVFFIKHLKDYTKLYFFGGLLYLYMLIWSFIPLQFDYGIQKAFLGLFVPLFVFGFIYRKNWAEAELLRYFTFSVFIISMIAIVYKIRYGLFVRSVPFGLLGPIPFGWVNGMALLALALRKDKKTWDFLLMIFFFLMLIWNGSKGPLVAFFIVALPFYKRVLGDKWSTKIIVFGLLIGAYFFIQTYGDEIRSVRMIKAYVEDPQGYSEGVGSGSIGARENLIGNTFMLIEENPFLGVGFGGWADQINTKFKYPHNVYLELWSEMGLMGLTLFIGLLFTLRYRSIFGYIGIFGLICLSFSGDISYFRYAFFPLLISTFIIKNNRTLYQSKKIKNKIKIN